jgi:hypothetical protein
MTPPYRLLIVTILRRIVAGALTVGILSGCSSSSSTTTERSVSSSLGAATSTTLAAAPIVTCGLPLTSSGPDAARVVLTLTAPTQARSGSTVTPTATFTVTGDGEIAGLLGQPVNVVIVRNGLIVGAYTGASGGTGVAVGNAASSNGGQAIPVAPVLLSGCPATRIDYGHPNATRHPLPPGDYQLVAILEADGYGVPTSLIVSAPRSIRVTN